LQEFANSYNNEINAILIFSEKQCSGDISLELYNLAMITGKLSKTASGLIPLKEKNNSQGIFDMGAFPCIELGGLFNDFKPNKMLIPALKDGDFENILIFGEDPIGTALNKDDVSQWFEKQEFMLVQDSFMTETAKMADLILPASFPIESAGSFTNTQRIIQQFDKQVEAPFRTNFEQLSCLGAHFGLKEYQTVDEAFMEFVSLLPKSKKEVFKFKISDDNSKQRRFDYGADYLMMRFDKEFFGEINV
jgi:formate dehydrogenase major subunit